MFWQNKQKEIQECADKYRVSNAIHPDDFIFDFIIKHPGFSSDAERVDYYFTDGARSARQLQELIGQHLDTMNKVRLLEFASGYGCVTRHLVHAGGIDLQACDIHEEAMAFLRKEMNADCVQSSPYPERLTLPRDYDCVFALSFFSHMPVTTWSRWFVRLAQAVTPGGILVFTTHGDHSRPLFKAPEFDDLGFWFAPKSEQKDLSLEEYGLTAVSEAFVKRHVPTVPGLELIEVRPGYWWNHQDLYIFRKEQETA
jgi:SAM-dependent methyltransferase